jgi:hypothetical protein
MALVALSAPPSPTEITGVLPLARETTNRARYYCSPTTIAYALHRSPVPLAQVPDRLTRRPGTSEGVLPASQWLTMSGQRDDALIASVLDAQAKDGSWAAEGWCTGTAQVPMVWGSEAVSTALCAEALATVLQYAP